MHYEFWMHFLPIIIYILLICLLIIGIILGIKTIITMDKVDKAVDNINAKIKSLDSLFNVVDFATEKVSLITDHLMDFVSGIFGRLISKKNSKKNEEEDDE